MARGSCWHPADAAIAEELLRTAMVSNYIDMKQEMAHRITQAWEYRCECLQIGRRETDNAYVLKAFGGKVSRSKNCSMVVSLSDMIRLDKESECASYLDRDQMTTLTHLSSSVFGETPLSREGCDDDGRQHGAQRANGRRRPHGGG